MKKTIVFLLSLFLIQTAAAINVATITDFGDGTVIKDCVAINSGESIYNVYKNLDRNRDDVDIDFDGDKIPPYNPYIKSINDLGAKTEGDKYYGWNFWVTNEDKNDFTDPPELAPGWGMGIGDYKITSPEVIGMGYSFTEFNADWTIKIPPEKPDFESYEEICEKLSIEEVTAYVDSDKDTLREGDKIKNVKPESKLKLKVKVKNLYEDSIKLNDVLITAVIKDIDNGDDLEEEADSFDLDADDSKTETIEFQIPLEVEEDNYNLLLTIEAEDSKGVGYEKTLTYTVEVDKEKHNVEIRKTELTSAKIVCSGTTSLNVNVINMGANEEDVVLEIISDDLNLHAQQSFKLSEDPFDKDNSYNAKFPIKTEGQQAGSYPIAIRASYDTKTEEKTVSLEIEECEEKDIIEKSDFEDIFEKNENKQEIITSKITNNIQKNLQTKKSDNGYIIIVILGIVAIVLFGGFLGAKLVR